MGLNVFEMGANVFANLKPHKLVAEPTQFDSRTLG